MKILIADDHPIVRTGIKQIISDFAKQTEIQEAADGQEVVTMIMNTDFDLVVLDISMPKGGGLDALVQIKKLKPKTKILMLSIYDDDQYIIQALKTGADGYLTKSGAPEELENAVSKIMEGGKYLSPHIAEKLVDIFSNDYEKLPHNLLSKREFQVFCQIAKGNKINDIAEDLFLSPKTVSTYKKRILEKTGLKSSYDIINYALKNNLRI
jgi:two-component system, NarL family, invasion response regulator UvrY